MFWNMSITDQAFNDEDNNFAVDSGYRGSRFLTVKSDDDDDDDNDMEGSGLWMSLTN